MPLVVTPEVGIPLPFDTTPEELNDFRQKAHAYFQTVEAVEGDAASTPTKEDKEESHRIFASAKLPVPKEVQPGAIRNLEAMLSEWDHEVLDVNRRLRNYITNKLILETADPDPKVRLKALEMLGKTSNVGMFSERVDITVTHRTISDIETDLRKTLELFGGQVHDVEAIDVTPNPASLVNIDLDDEFGVDQEDEDGRSTARTS